VSVWKQLFHATWKQFDNHFGSLLEQMRHHKALVETQANLTAFEEARQARMLVRLEFKAIEDRETTWRKSFVLSWLSAADVSTFQDKGRATRKDIPESGKWLLKRDLYRMWSNPASPAAQLLWVNGKPGAGNALNVSATLICQSSLIYR